MIPSGPSAPRWFVAVIIVVMLPVFQLPLLLNYCEPDSAARTMVWIYPFYVLMAGWFAYQCYPQRRALAWILLILMVLSHAAIYILATTPASQVVI